MSDYWYSSTKITNTNYAGVLVQQNMALKKINAVKAAVALSVRCSVNN